MFIFLKDSIYNYAKMKEKYLTSTLGNTKHTHTHTHTRTHARRHVTYIPFILMICTNNLYKMYTIIPYTTD